MAGISDRSPSGPLRRVLLGLLRRSGSLPVGKALAVQDAEAPAPEPREFRCAGAHQRRRLPGPPLLVASALSAFPHFFFSRSSVISPGSRFAAGTTDPRRHSSM
jgi:hypothetical protein